MNAVILCVGALKERWHKEGCAEYMKRLTRYGKFDIEQVDDCPEPDKPSPELDRRVIDKEGAALMRRLRADDRVIALCVEGEMMPSERFARALAEWEGDGRRNVYILGGSLGLSEAVKRRANAKLSLSQMTYPHALARIILLEQLYRAARINAGERYHK